MDEDLEKSSKERIWRVVVDECVGPNSILFRQFKRHFSQDRPFEFVFLSAAHRAIPDPEILRKVLSRDTILLTTDRVLHNEARELGFPSYTLDGNGQLTAERLAHVRVMGAPPTRPNEELRSDYTHPANEIACALKHGMPERAFQRYRTRRRRIRGYFGSEANIGLVAVTIGSKSTRKGLLCGYLIALAGKCGIKGIRASEGYGIGGSDQRDAAFCLLHALKELYLLQLEQVRTELYIMPPDSLTLCQGLMARTTPTEISRPAEALTRLLGGLISVTVHPCMKGRFFDAMENKLARLAQHWNNEIVRVDFPELLDALLSESRLAHSTLKPETKEHNE